MPRADRVRKARKSSTLACGCYIRPGHMIARVAGRWLCIEHALQGGAGGRLRPVDQPLTRL
jgi:hypothetical protein